MKKDQRGYQAAFLLACGIVGLVLFSGIAKVLHPAAFSLAVYRFHLLPDALVNVVAIYLPWLELVCAFALLFLPRWRRPALHIALFLFLLFAAGMGVNLLRGSPFSCGCFGEAPLAPPMNWLGVARNLALSAIALLGLHAGQMAEQLQSREDADA